MGGHPSGGRLGEQGGVRRAGARSQRTLSPIQRRGSVCRALASGGVQTGSVEECVGVCPRRVCAGWAVRGGSRGPSSLSVAEREGQERREKEGVERRERGAGTPAPLSTHSLFPALAHAPLSPAHPAPTPARPPTPHTHACPPSATTPSHTHISRAPASLHAQKSRQGREGGGRTRDSHAHQPGRRGRAGGGGGGAERLGGQAPGAGGGAAGGGEAGEREGIGRERRAGAGGRGGLNLTFEDLDSTWRPPHFFSLSRSSQIYDLETRYLASANPQGNALKGME